MTVPQDPPILPNGFFSKSWRLFFQGTASTSGETANPATVTQATSKSTGVTVNAPVGQITTTAAALGAGAVVTFTLTNTSIAAGDIVLAQVLSGPAAHGTYQVWAENTVAGAVSINLRNITAGALAEALVIVFAVVKSVTQ